MVEKSTTEAAPAAKPAAAASKTDFKSFFKVILDAALKPMTAFKEHLPKFTDFKNAGIIVLIVVVAMTILSTISSVVKVVRTEECVENCSMFSSKSEKKKVETKWNWDNLSEFNWFETEGKQFIVNILVIALLSGAYFGIAKAFKDKDANYCRMATVVALGMVPSAVLTFIAPVVGMINLTLGGIVGWAGMIYSVSIIFIGLNNEVKVEGDKKVYLNVIALAAVVLGYYIIAKLIYGDVYAAVIEMFIQAGSGTADPTGVLSGIFSM